MADLFIPPLAEWPTELRVLYVERCNIREFDGGASREDAEAAAFAEVWEARNGR